MLIEDSPRSHVPIYIEIMNKVSDIDSDCESVQILCI